MRAIAIALMLTLGGCTIPCQTGTPAEQDACWAAHDRSNAMVQQMLERNRMRRLERRVDELESRTP